MKKNKKNKKSDAVGKLRHLFLLCSISGISNACGAATGGAKTKVYAVATEDVETDAEYDTDFNSTSDVVLKANKMWTELVFDYDSTSYEENAPGGNFLEYKIKGFGKKIQPSLVKALNGFLGVPLLLIVEDRTGNVRLFGDSVDGVYLTDGKGGTGAKHTDTSGINFEFGWSSSHPAIFYNEGAIDLESAS